MATLLEYLFIYLYHILYCRTRANTTFVLKSLYDFRPLCWFNIFEALTPALTVINQPKPGASNHSAQALGTPTARGCTSASVAAGYHTGRKSRIHTRVYHDPLGQIRAPYRSLNSSLERRPVHKPFWRKSGRGNLRFQSGARPDTGGSKQANNPKYVTPASSAARTRDPA